MKKSEQLEKQIKTLSMVIDVKSIDKKSRIIRGVIGTTGNLDRHGDTVNPDGWLLDNFLKNPVIFVNHASWEMPVGKAIEVRKVENGLEFDIQFSTKTEQANEAWGLIEEGIMKAWSVGFIVLDWGRPGDEYTIMKQELLELSLVGLPANPDAMSPKQAQSLKALQSLIESKGVKHEAKAETPETPEVPETPEKKIDDEDVVIPEDEDKLKMILDKLNSLEAEVKEIKETQEKSLQNIVDFTNQVKSDEQITEDHVFLALNDIQSELRSEDKDIGKTLSQVNKVLKLIGKDNSHE